MSSMVSRRPSSRNHWNEAFWISIRLGRSRMCSRRENDLRARGEATVVVKKSGLPMDERVEAKVGVATGVRSSRRAERQRNLPGYRKRRFYRKQKPQRAPKSDRRNCSAGSVEKQAVRRGKIRAGTRSQSRRLLPSVKGVPC